MRRTPNKKHFVFVFQLLALLLFLTTPLLYGQQNLDIRISHEGLKCVRSDEHVVLQANIISSEELIAVTAYFRSDLYDEYYYVKMRETEGTYRGTLPKPSAETGKIHYYILAMDSPFNSVRTQEHTPEVVLDEDNCQEDNPIQPIYVNSPSIEIGSTVANNLPPPGFLSDGILSGSKMLLEGLITGGTGAAAAAIFFAGGEGNLEQTSVASTIDDTPFTTPPPTSTTNNAMVKACFETDPSPPVIYIGESIRFDASCTTPGREQIQSYTWNFNDERGGREGRVINRTYQKAGVFPAELTVTTTGNKNDKTVKDVQVTERPTTPSEPSNTADLQIVSLSAPSNTNVEQNTSYTIFFSNNGPADESSATITITFTASTNGSIQYISGGLGCTIPLTTGSSINITCTNSMPASSSNSHTLTVVYLEEDIYSINATISNETTTDPVPGNNSAAATTTAALLPLRTLKSTKQFDVISHIDSSTLVNGTLEFNATTNHTTISGHPKRYVFPAKRGTNVVEAYFSSADFASGSWSFELRDSTYFEPGSVVVESGNIILVNANRIVMQLSGRPERFRFRFRVIDRGR